LSCIGGGRQPAEFLREALESDGEWALVVDALSESLHEDAVKARTGL